MMRVCDGLMKLIQLHRFDTQEEEHIDKEA